MGVDIYNDPDFKLPGARNSMRVCRDNVKDIFGSHSLDIPVSTTVGRIQSQFMLAGMWHCPEEAVQAMLNIEGGLDGVGDALRHEILK